MFWKRPRPQNTLLGNVLGGRGLLWKRPQPLSEYQIFSEYKSNGAPRAMRSALFVVFFRRSISGANRIAAAKRAKNRLYFLSACAILYVRHNSISFSVHRYNRHYCISFFLCTEGNCVAAIGDTVCRACLRSEGTLFYFVPLPAKYFLGGRI